MLVKWFYGLAKCMFPRFTVLKIFSLVFYKGDCMWVAFQLGDDQVQAL